MISGKHTYRVFNAHNSQIHHPRHCSGLLARSSRTVPHAWDALGPFFSRLSQVHLNAAYAFWSQSLLGHTEGLIPGTCPAVMFGPDPSELRTGLCTEVTDPSTLESFRDRPLCVFQPERCRKEIALSRGRAALTIPAALGGTAASSASATTARGTRRSTGSAQAGPVRPRDREPTTSSRSHRFSFSIALSMSCRRGGSIGNATTVCARSITAQAGRHGACLKEILASGTRRRAGGLRAIHRTTSPVSRSTVACAKEPSLTVRQTGEDPQRTAAASGDLHRQCRHKAALLR